MRRVVEDVIIGIRRYVVWETPHSSNRLGPCDVCRGHCPTVYSQIEHRCFLQDEHDPQLGELAWYPVKGGHRHGHLECLRKLREAKRMSILEAAEKVGIGEMTPERQVELDIITGRGFGLEEEA